MAIGKSAIDQIGNTQPDLPPLDDPPAMVAWWERRMQFRVPPKLLSLAVEARLNPTADQTEPIDVDQLDVAKLDSLRQARRYLAAIDQKLSGAYRAGDEAQIRRWQKPFNDALDSVRKAEAAERDAAKVAGELIPKADVCTEIAQLLEVVRQMRSTIRRRVTARLADLSPELLERIGNVVDQEREGEDSVFRHLNQFRSLDEIHFQLKQP